MRAESESGALSVEYGLPVISWRLVPGRRDDPEAELDLAVTLRRGARTLLEDTVFPSAEMKLPPSIRAVADATGVLGARVPEWVESELTRGLAEVPPEQPVWLEIASPAGHLAAVPWEHMLRRVLGERPLLRLPSTSVRPLVSQSNLDVAICAVTGRYDAPYDLKERTAMVVKAMTQAFPEGTRIHIFARAPEHVGETANAPNVITHSPGSADALEPEEPADPDDLQTGVPGRLENPWLCWMLAAAGNVPLDVVHFICPGYLDYSYGALDLGAAPIPEVEERSTRLATAGQLMAFLTRAGAWGAGITIPTSAAWPAGTRILADRISRLRPGPLLVHAPHHSRGDHVAELTMAYRLLFTESRPEVPRSRAFSLYIHPGRVRGIPVPLGGVAERQAETLTLAGTPAEELIVKGDAPAWLAANQRNLERWATAAVNAGMAELKGREGAEQGVNDALMFVSKLIDQSAEEGTR